jgi:hypothetical protein
MIIDDSITETVRLPWPTICKLAVKAYIAGLSFEEIIVQAVRERVAREAA